MSFVLFAFWRSSSLTECRTTTTSAPQNSVLVYVRHHLHRVVTDDDKIVVVVKLVVVAGNTQRRKQRRRSPLKRTFSLLLFYSFLLTLFCARFSSLFIPWWDAFFCTKIFRFGRQPKLQIIFKHEGGLFSLFFLSSASFHFSSGGNFFKQSDDVIFAIQLHKNYAHKKHKRIETFISII